MAGDVVEKVMAGSVFDVFERRAECETFPVSALRAEWEVGVGTELDVIGFS